MIYQEESQIPVGTRTEEVEIAVEETKTLWGFLKFVVVGEGEESIDASTEPIAPAPLLTEAVVSKQPERQLPPDVIVSELAPTVVADVPSPTPPHIPEAVVPSVSDLLSPHPDPVVSQLETVDPGVAPNSSQFYIGTPVVREAQVGPAGDSTPVQEGGSDIPSLADTLDQEEIPELKPDQTLAHNDGSFVKGWNVRTVVDVNECCIVCGRRGLTVHSSKQRSLSV